MSGWHGWLDWNEREEGHSQSWNSRDWREFSESESDGGTWHCGHYSGSIIHGRCHGSGELHLTGGAIYDGGFERGYFHGHGKMRDPLGGGYEGQYNRGRMHGHGRLQQSDGSAYQGQFDRGERHGKGTCSFPTGEKYDAEWVRDKIVEEVAPSHTPGTTSGPEMLREAYIEISKQLTAILRYKWQDKGLVRDSDGFFCLNEVYLCSNIRHPFDVVREAARCSNGRDGPRFEFRHDEAGPRIRVRHEAGHSRSSNT